MCRDHKSVLLRTGLDGNFVENRTRDFIGRLARTERMNSRSREDIPSRHLAHVFVADKSFHAVLVRPIADEPCPVLRQVGPTEMVEEERHMVHRLIGMVIVLVPTESGRRLFIISEIQ